jgi:hypothetical protein
MSAGDQVAVAAGGAACRALAVVWAARCWLRRPRTWSVNDTITHRRRRRLRDRRRRGNRVTACTHEGIQLNYRGNATILDKSAEHNVRLW